MRSLNELKRYRRGQTQFTIFTFMITAFLVVVFFAGLIYTMGILNGVFHQIGVDNEVNVGKPLYVNMTQASDQIFGQAYQSIQALRMVAVVYILALGAAIIITSGLQKIHPLFFFAYILICVLAVVFAPTIANAYEALLSSGIYGGELANFTASNFLLLNLPIVVLVISVLGGIFLFVNLIRAGNEGELR